MKIVFIGPSDSIHLVRWMRFFIDQGWDTVYFGNCLALLEPIEGLRLRHFAPGRGLVHRLWNLRAYRQALAAERPDLINVHYLDHNAWAVLASGGVPVVLSGWGTDILSDPYRSPGCRRRLRFVCRQAALVTSIAPHMTTVLTEYVGVPAGKIMTQLWGCDTRVFRPAARSVRDPARLTIIHNRLLEPSYNWETLVRAIPLILARRPACRFLFANGGSETARARALIATLGVGSAVEWVGPVPTARLVELLQRSDLFVSLAFSDGNNISLNEAMACGVFPICSDTLAHRQWITHGENGIVLRDAHASGELAEVIAGFDPAAPLVRAAAEMNAAIVRERADFQINVGKIADRYRELVAWRRSPPARGRVG